MRFWRRLFVYVGNRGIVLSLLGVIWVVTAIGLYVDPLKRAGLPDDIVPIPVRICLWAVAGLFAMVATWWRRLDEFAWGLLIVAPSMRLLSYGYGWIFGTFPPGWRSVLVYAATVLLVNRCAAGLDRPAPWDGRERRWTPQQ